MRKVFENKFVVMYLDEDHQLLNDIWTEASSDLTTELFKEIMYEWRNLVIVNNVALALIDTRKMQFMIEPELQSWIATEINGPAQQHSLRKAANLLPPTIFEQVGIEQTMAELQGVNSFMVRIFKDESEAKTWLFS